MSVPYSAMCLLQSLTFLISLHKTLRSKDKCRDCVEKIMEKCCSCVVKDKEENIEDDESSGDSEDWY